MKSRTLFGLIVGLMLGAASYFGLVIVLGSSLDANVAATVASGLSLAVAAAGFFGTVNLFVDHDLSERIDRMQRSLWRPRDAEEREAIEAFLDEGATPQILQDAAKAAQRLLRLPETRIPEIKMKMLAAGFQSDRAVLYYLIARMLGPVVGVGFGFLMAFELQALDLGHLSVYCLIGFVVGLLGPDNLVGNRVNARRAVISIELPDALDLALIYTESGETFDQSLMKVNRALKRRAPTTVEEFRMLERELQLLPSRERAYLNLIERVDTPMMRNVVAIIRQNDEAGTPISAALRVLSKAARDERMSNAERKAARIPVFINIPVLLFVMPSIFIVVLSPAVLRIIEIFRNF